MNSPTNETPTPRTDAARALRNKACQEITTESICCALDDGNALKRLIAKIPPGGWEVAEQLEIELAAMTKERDKLKAQLEFADRCLNIVEAYRAAKSAEMDDSWIPWESYCKAIEVYKSYFKPWTAILPPEPGKTYDVEEQSNEPSNP